MKELLKVTDLPFEQVVTSHVAICSAGNPLVNTVLQKKSNENMPHNTESIYIALI